MTTFLVKAGYPAVRSIDRPRARRDSGAVWKESPHDETRSGVLLLSATLAFDAVLYAKDLDAVAGFYARLLDVVPLTVESTHVVLPIGDGRLWVHAIPAAYATSIRIAQPPALREDAAIKLSFAVASLSVARDTGTAHGGGVSAPERAWQDQGTWYLDAWDPEGNVFQLRAQSVG